MVSVFDFVLSCVGLSNLIWLFFVKFVIDSVQNVFFVGFQIFRVVDEYVDKLGKKYKVGSIYRYMINFI